jgi:RNA polymerase sigma factor (TIGR02999 family)
VESDSNLSLLLRRAAEGDAAALDDAVRVTYEQLERVARRHLNLAYGPRADSATLEPAALVNEAFVRLRDQRNAFANRGQFYAVATKVMLRALRDYERARAAGKRGGDRVRVSLAGLAAHGNPTLTTAVDLAAALDELEEHDPRKAQVVRLRVLWGLRMAEIAEALDVSLPTVDRDWRFARVWLRNRLTS